MRITTSVRTEGPAEINEKTPNNQLHNLANLIDNKSLPSGRVEEQALMFEKSKGNCRCRGNTK